MKIYLFILMSLLATANAFWTAYRNKHPRNGENAIVPALPWTITGAVFMLAGLSGFFEIWIALVGSLGYGLLSALITIKIER